MWQQQIQETVVAVEVTAKATIATKMETTITTTVASDGCVPGEVWLVMQ